jgi:hypothetical protein
MVLEHPSLSEAQIHAPLPCLFSHFIFYLMECSPEQPSTRLRTQIERTTDERGDSAERADV